MSALDWSGLLRAGLRGLGLKPVEFWALSPAELLLMLGADGSQAPLTRERLSELAKDFPDILEVRRDNAE